MTEEILNCSFCAKTSKEVKKLIAGTNVYICDECVDLCYGILHAPADTPKVPEGEIPTPHEIKAFLDEYVIGQDHAKKVMAVAVHEHYKRLTSPVMDGVEIDKSNLLMIGPSGSGKTLLAQTIARMLNVPFAIADATSLTEAGYVGDDVESIITRLLQAASYDVRQTERGIVFLDEVDKKANRASNGTTRDVSGEGVQQALLKLLEGSDILAPAQGGRKNPNAEMIKINTKNILFIVGGAFVGLDKIVERDVAKNETSIGFGASIGKQERNLSETMANLQPEHLISYGMIPELIGRLPVMTVLDELTEEQLVTVLTTPRNSLVKQYTAMFKFSGVDLEFTPEALSATAKIAVKRKTGGRALRGVLEARLLGTRFDLPEMKKNGAERVIVDVNTIEVIYGKKPNDPATAAV